MQFRPISFALISSLLFAQITQIPQTGGSSSAGRYAATMSSATTWSVPGATHGLGTADIGIFVSSDSGTTYDRVEPNTCTVNKTSYDVTCTFTTAQAGRILLVGGASGGGGGDTTTVANSGSGAKVLKPSTNVTARTIVAGTGIQVTETTDTVEIASTTSGNAWLTATESGLDLASLSANTCEASERNTTVSGATAGWPAVVVLPWEANKTTLLSVSAVVSSPNTVTWRVCNNSAGAVDMAAGNYTVYVIPPIN